MTTVFGVGAECWDAWIYVSWIIKRYNGQVMISDTDKARMKQFNRGSFRNRWQGYFIAFGQSI